MKSLRLIFSVFIALLLPAGVSGQTDKPAPARKAVLVELFTSEGCSSCPPADEFLGRLRQVKLANGTEILPLGLHVDYWNHQGWVDRFSSSAYTERQRVYTEKLHTAEAYTPQMVVDGATQFNGSDVASARKAIAQAAARPQLADVRITPAAEDKVQVIIAASPKTSGEVLLALTEDNLMTKVKAGENDKRELHHAAVVRELRVLGRLKNGAFEAAGVPLKIKQDWKRADMRVVVFVQEPNGIIDGASWLDLAGSEASAR
jgi:hypothetical protein